MAHLLPENNTLGFRRRQDEEDKPWSLPGEFVRAVGTGARATAQSIAELPKIIPGIDYEVTVPEFTERPQTVGGDIAAAMVQFAVPYGVVLKGISLGSRLFGAGRAARTAAEAARAAQVASSARTAEAITTAPKVGQAAEVARKATLLDDAVVPIPLTKRQKLVKYAGAGAAADFIAFSPNDPTLGNFIQGLGGDKIPVINAISDLLATDEDDSDALNRFRHVMEGLGLGAAVPMVFKGLGKGLSLSGQAIDKVTPYAKDARGRPVYKQDVLVKTEPRKKKDGTPDLRFKQKPPQYEKRQINIIEYRRDKLVGALDKTIQNFVDKSHAVRLIDEAYEKFNPNKPHALRNGLNAWKERRMLVSIEEQQIRAYNDGFYRTGIDGVPVRYSNHKSMKEIEQNIVKVAELSPTTRQETIDLHQDYLYAVQAKQHKATKKLSGLDDEKIKNTLARVEALPSNIKTAFETSVKDLKDYNNAALRLLLDEGIIDKATFDNIGKVKVGRKLEDRLWIPMLRQGDDRAIELALASWAPTIPKGSKVSISRADLSKLSQAELREYNIENPLNQAYNNLELGYDHIIKSVAENRAKRAMYDTIIELGEQGTKWAVKSTKVVTRKDISGRGIKELLGKQGGALKDTLNDSDIFKMFSSKYDITNKTDIIYRDGKAEVWDIKDPLLMDSLQAMGPQLTKDFTRFYMRWGGKFKNFLTRMVTSSPTFFFGSNFARDTLSVGILMKGFIPFISSYRGLYHQLRNTDIAKRLEVSGGTFGNRAYTDFGTSKEFQGRNASRIHTIDGPKGLTKVVGFIDKWTSKFEMASRTEAFRLFTKQGYSDNVAAFKAREIAVDFAQSGSSANFRLATSTVPFLNASIQGLSRTLRALGGKKLTGKKLTAEEVEEVGRAWTNMMAVTTVGGVLLPMAHYTSSDESIRTTYDEIPKYLKDTNFVWVTPKIDGVNQIILLPKPFDFGIIPTIAEKFLDEEFIESDAMVVREYLRTAFLNSTRLGDASLAPQFIRPLIELKINKKFTGAPIVPRNLQGGTIAQRRFWTSPTATFFADVAGSLNFKPEWTKSPLAVEHILNSYFGTVGGFVMDYITDPVFRGMLELPDKPIEPEGRRWPWEEGALGLGKVGKVLPVQIRSDALSTTRSVNELYDAFNKAKSFKIDFDSVKNNLDGFTQKHFQEMIKDPETMFFLIQYPMLEEALSNLADINKQIKNLATLDPGDLAARDALTQMKQVISRQFMKVYYIQRNRFSREQQGMAEGGLVERNPDEFSTIDGPTMHPAIKKYIGKNDMIQQGMKDGGLVERSVQGMAHGGPATDHSVFGTLLPGAAARIEQDEYRLTAENWADISDNIQLKEGTINGFYLDDKGNWTAGTGHLVLSEDWDKYDVTITLPTGEEVSRDQFHKTESKTITVDGVEVTLPSLKAIGQIAVIDVEDGGTVHGEYRINSTPVGTRNAAGETIYPNLTDDIASWWATDFEEKTASAKEQAEEIMAAWKSDNFVGVPPQITNKRMVNILEALVDLNFNVGTSWHKDVGEKKGFTGVYDGLLTGNFTNAALNLKWRNIDPAIDDDAATVPVATPYAIENTARMNANMKLLEGVTTEAILATFRPPPKPELTPAPSLVRPTEASTRAGLTPLVQQRLNDAMQAVRQFEPAPEGMSAGEKYLLEYHRDNLRNETYLIGEDGRVSTVYVSGVTGPDGRIYNVPGYFNGQLHENEDEIKAQVEKIGWENYPAYATGEEANAAAQAFHEIIDQDANTPWVKEMLSAPAPAPFNLVPPSVMADAIQRDKPPIPGIQSKPRDIPPIPGIQSNLAKGGLVKRKYYSGAGYH